MTNYGIAPNTALGAWKYYFMDIKTAGSGGETQPFFDPYDGTYQYGRYQQDIGTGWVNAQIQVAFVGATTVGSGSAYVFRLPKPFVRPVPGQASYIPIGYAMCYWSYSTNFDVPNHNMPCIALPADPYASLGGQEDYYCQVMAPYTWDQNSFNIPTSSSNVTFGHELGKTPNMQDISIVFNTTSSNASTPHWISAASSSSITLNLRANYSGAQTTHYYKLETDGGIVSPIVPWKWANFTTFSPYGNIFIQLSYQGKL